jgi:hypothetical protein
MDATDLIEFLSTKARALKSISRGVSVEAFEPKVSEKSPGSVSNS